MSINTTAYDRFRQGIYRYKLNIIKGIAPTVGPELTGSIIIQNTFGQPKTHDDVGVFEDDDRYNASVYINNLSGFAVYLDQMDGVIEPFTIRADASFTTIESPYLARSIKGEFGNGNSDFYRRHDQAECVFPIEAPLIIAPFEDASDYMGDTQSASVPLPGFSSTKQAALRPFKEVKLEDNKKSIVFEHEVSGSDMISALNAMNPSTDSFLDNETKSARTGFTYTNAPQGVDSVAFGGLLRG